MKIINQEHDDIDFHAECDCGVQFLYNKYDVEYYDGYCVCCPICARLVYLDISLTSHASTEGDS